MGKQIKKNKYGESTKYISRAKAIRKLQVSLKDFRRLCILKGIYPREPTKKLQKTHKTFYHVKDIKFLMHDKLLQKFYEIKTHIKKIKKAQGKNEKQRVKQLLKQKPTYTLHHLIKERYPTFIDAIRDLEDPLCLVNLFANFPSHKALGVSRDRIENCIRLAREFNLYCIKTHSLKKVFLSIKGIYYQAEIEGQPITWIAPYQLPIQLPLDVDYKIMLTFLEFYEVLLKFVHYKLFDQLNIKYPFEMDASIENNTHFSYKAFIVQQKENSQKFEKEKEENERFCISDRFQNDEQVQKMTNKLNNTATLFNNLIFFLSAEVPRYSLEFVILAAGGDVFWSGDESGVDFEDQRITHVITDRKPEVINFLSNREYVQPQWIYDSFNVEKLLPIAKYSPGKILPPHLSPFVERENNQFYIPKREIELRNLKGENIYQEEYRETEQQIQSEEEQIEKLDKNANKLEESKRAEKQQISSEKLKKNNEQQKKKIQNSKNKKEDMIEEIEEPIAEFERESESAQLDENNQFALLQDRNESNQEESEEEMEQERSSNEVAEEIQPTQHLNDEEFDIEQQKQSHLAQQKKINFESRELGKKLMSKKQKKMYEIMTFKQQQLQKEAEKLKQKAKKIQKKQKQN